MAETTRYFTDMMKDRKSGQRLDALLAESTPYMLKSLGLKLDGSDSTDNIQTAINTLSATHKVILFPFMSTINLTKKISIPSNVTIDFNNTLINMPTSANFPALEIKNSNIKIKNLRIIESNHNYLSTESAIKVTPTTDVENISFVNVEVEGCRGIQINPDNSHIAKNITFDNCKVSFSGFYGYHLWNCINVFFDNCIGYHNFRDGIKMERNTVDVKIFAGEYSYNGADNTVDNGNGIDGFAGGNRFSAIGVTCEYNNGAGIHLLSSTLNDINVTNPIYGYIRNNTLIDCRSNYNKGDGIDCVNLNPSASGPLISGINMTNCVCIGNDKAGITLNGSKYININSCEVRFNKYEGIVVKNSFYVDLLSVRSISNGYTNTGYSGIKISQTKKIRVISGISNGADSSDLWSDDESALTKYHKNGLLIEDATLCDDIYIFEMEFKNYTDKPVDVLNYSVATSRIVIHYGDIGSVSRSNVSGSIGSSLWQSGKLYNKNSELASNTWLEGRKRSEGTQGFTANGITDTFNIAHGLGIVPKRINVTPRNSTSTAAYYIYADATNLTIKFVSVPANGTALSFNWFADA